MSEDLGLKVQQLQALLYYGGYYDGALGNNRTNMSATLSAITNARLGFSLEQMSNFNGAMLDDALGKMKNKFESNPRMQYALVKDIDTHMKSDKRNEIHVLSGRALQGLGYHIKNRDDYGQAASDFKDKHRPPVRVIDLKECFNCEANPKYGQKVNLLNQFKGAAANPAVTVSYEPAPPKQDVPKEPEIQPQEGQLYSGVDWDRIPPVPVTEDMKHTLRMVAGVSDNAARKGVLDIDDDGHIILIRKTGEGDTAKIVAHDVTNEIDNIPGLGEVPISQKDFKIAADAFRKAKTMDVFDPRAGIKVHCLAEVEGWGSLNDKKYDLWVHEGTDGRIQVGLLTKDQKAINSDILSKAEIQTSDLDQFRAAQEFEVAKPTAALKI
ncbi:MAG TPA: hypothetical protein DEA55_00585 [Rhodospirillaceae bacterium]|nr:hypothetical protein [Rhodospirillaceae bacterium]